MSTKIIGSAQREESLVREDDRSGPAVPNTLLGPNGLLQLPEPKEVVDLPLPPCESGAFSLTTHVFTREELLAIDAARLARRPLLLRGEPGVGKTQLGRAAAVALGRAFVYQTLDSRTEPHELLWRVDAVARLGQAQLLARPSGEGGDVGALELGNFLQPGALWWAFDFGDAKEQASRAGEGPAAVAYPDRAAGGVVALIDEIDKADPGVPNGLLDALGAGAFSRPDRVRVRCEDPAPLILIATNEERTLPDAFLRRCLVLHLGLPEGKDAVEWLLRRSRDWSPRVPESVQRRVAETIVSDRTKQGRQVRARVGLAEHLDLLRALAGFAPNDVARQEALAGELLVLVLRKREERGG